MYEGLEHQDLAGLPGSFIAPIIEKIEACLVLFSL